MCTATELNFPRPLISLDTDNNLIIDTVIDTSNSVSYLEVNAVLQKSAAMQQLLSVVSELTKKSEELGSYVKILKEYACCPVMIGNDGKPVFLYELIETIDENIDYERLKEELPTLSYSHFSGAISFLRRLSQFNIKSIDIDELEEEIFFSDENNLIEIQTALNEEEKHVLNFVEFSGR